MFKGQDILNTDPKFLIDKDSVIRKLQDELRRKTIKFNDAYKGFKELRLEKIKAWNKIQETEGDAEVEAVRKGKHSASKRKVGEEAGSSPKRVKQDEETTTSVSLAPRSSNTSTEDSSPAITPPPITTNSSNPSQQAVESPEVVIEQQRSSLRLQRKRVRWYMEQVSVLNQGLDAKTEESKKLAEDKKKVGGEVKNLKTQLAENQETRNVELANQIDELKKILQEEKEKNENQEEEIAQLKKKNFDLKVANIVCTEDLPRAGRLLSESDRKLPVERQRTKELKAENQRLKEESQSVEWKISNIGEGHFVGKLLSLTMDDDKIGKLLVSTFQWSFLLEFEDLFSEFNDAYKGFKELRLEKIKAWNKLQGPKGDAEVEAERKGKPSASKRKVGEEAGSSQKRMKQDKETTKSVSSALSVPNTSTEDSSPAITPPPTTTNLSDSAQQASKPTEAQVDHHIFDDMECDMSASYATSLIPSSVELAPIQPRVVYRDHHAVSTKTLLRSVRETGRIFSKGQNNLRLCIRKMCLAWIRAMIGECKNRFSDLFMQWQENPTDFYFTWKLSKELLRTQSSKRNSWPMMRARRSSSSSLLGKEEISETVVEESKLDEEMLRNEEMKKCDVKESSEEKEVETKKTSGEENVGAKKTFEKEDIETEKDSGEEKFDFSKNIYKKKEASLKDKTKLATPNEALPAPAAENAQKELVHVLAPLEAKIDNNDPEPCFPKRSRRVSKRYPENELIATILQTIEIFVLRTTLNFKKDLVQCPSSFC
ncbi:unnamed protein product [Caenorhabditis brenneri]